MDYDELDASSEASVDHHHKRGCANAKTAARPRRSNAAQNKHIKAVFTSGSSSEESADTTEDGLEGPIEETTAIAPDGTVINVTYRGVDPSLVPGSKEWKKAKRLADNRASAARSRALQRLKVGDLGKQLESVRMYNEQLAHENQMLKTLLAAHGITLEAAAASKKSASSHEKEKEKPAKPSKKARAPPATPAVSRVDSVQSASTAHNSDADVHATDFDSPLSAPSALLPIDEEPLDEGQFVLGESALHDDLMVPLPAMRETSMAADMLSAPAMLPAPAAGMTANTRLTSMAHDIAYLPPLTVGGRCTSMMSNVFDLLSPSRLFSSASPAGAFSVMSRSNEATTAMMTMTTTTTVSGVKRGREEEEHEAEDVVVEQPVMKRARGCTAMQMAFIAMVVCVAFVGLGMDDGVAAGVPNHIRGRLLLQVEDNHVPVAVAAAAVAPIHANKDGGDVLSHIVAAVQSSSLLSVAVALCFGLLGSLTYTSLSFFLGRTTSVVTQASVAESTMKLVATNTELQTRGRPRLPLYLYFICCCIITALPMKVCL